MIFTPAHLYSYKNRLRPCVIAGWQRVLQLNGWFSPPAYCNLTMCGNKSLADDLSVGQGAVSSRVALLLRSAEAKPSLPRFVLEKNIHFSPPIYRLAVMRSGIDWKRLVRWLNFNSTVFLAGDYKQRVTFNHT
jgi:hypothetical protein